MIFQNTDIKLRIFFKQFIFYITGHDPCRECCQGTRNNGKYNHDFLETNVRYQSQGIG